MSSDKSYPREELRHELESLLVPRARQDYQSLSQLLRSHVKTEPSVEYSINELAEIVVYLIKKKLIKP